MEIGAEFTTNSYGVVKIVHYKNSKNILIEFLDTRNQLTVQKVNLLNGQIQDVEERTRRRLEKERAEEGRKSEIANQRLLREEQRRLEADSRKTNKKVDADRKVAEKIASREAEMVGKEFTDYLGMSCKVVGLVEGSLATWRVCYVDSGNCYDASEKLLLRGTPFDKLREDYASLLTEYNRKKHAASYEANRAERIARALAYQRNNPEWARHRNNRRRARRLGAEGSHTREETDDLMRKQDWKCACCYTDLRVEVPHLDHIMPLARGGSDYIENIQWLCQVCNNMKGAKHPDVWNAHITTEEFKARRAGRNFQT